MLKKVAESTPATILPRRKIGYLRSGYEASFLILAGDPIRDFENTKHIVRRFKQCEWIELAK